ncbi:MAG: helix-turn-helix domain-containing protein [Armatimonadota bacterium]
MKKGNWYWIEKAFIREYTPKVGALGVAVYNYLASLVDTNQSCYPSQKHIAEVLGYSRTTINKVIKKLEDNGLVLVERSGRYSHIYRLLAVRCKAEETQM